jgi:hypothetical protein
VRQAITLLTGLVLLLAVVASGAGPLGAAALSDADSDGVPDSSDACPALAEDADGIDSSDGCPDTDASVSVTKDEAYPVAIGVAATKTADIWFKNGNYPADLIAHVLAVSTIGECEVTPVAEPGDGAFGVVTDEDGDTVAETMSFLLEWELSLAAGSMAHTTRDYEITCYTAGQHSFELQVDVVPLPPVEEEDVEDMPNVHKNFPVVTADDGSEPDSDGDGFTDVDESYLGTSPLSECPATSTSGDEEPDAFPADFDDNQAVNISDLGKILPPTFGSQYGGPNFVQRRDLRPNGVINILDIARVMPPTFGSNCG